MKEIIKEVYDIFVMWIFVWIKKFFKRGVRDNFVCWGFFLLILFCEIYMVEFFWGRGMDLFYFFLLGFIYYILFIIWDFFKLIVILVYCSFKNFCCGFFDKINKKFGYYFGFYS